MKKIFGFLLAAAVALSSCVCLVGCGQGKQARCSYNINAVLDEQPMRVSGDLIFTYVNSTDTQIDELCFHLFGRAYREGASAPAVSAAQHAAVYPNGESYGDMTVAEVTDAKGSPLRTELVGEDSQILSVSLARPLLPGEKEVLHIPFFVELANIRHRLGYTERAVNLGNWYPMLCQRKQGAYYECTYCTYGDPFYSACADYDVAFTCPEGYVLAAPCAAERTESIAGERYIMRLSNARDFALVLSEQFTRHTALAGQTEVNYYCYDDERPQRTLQTAVDALNYFERTFGGYPHGTYSVVQTEFSAGGMEYPGLVYVSDRVRDTELDITVVHETAHQWWYGIVGNNQVEQAWLDEGLAEYSTCLFLENHPAYGVTREDFCGGAERALRAFVEVKTRLGGTVDLTMNRNLRAFGSEYEYVNIAYNAGTLLFDGLRQSVGDKRFFAALRRYCNENAGGIASDASLIGAFERTGVNVQPYVESWVQGKIQLQK